MRCLSCDVILSDFEATRKYSKSGEFVDLCNKCFSTIEDDVEVVENYDLLEQEEVDEME